MTADEALVAHLTEVRGLRAEIRTALASRRVTFGAEYQNAMDEAAIDAAASSLWPVHSPSVETSAASTRSGDVQDAVGAHPDAARVALPRPASGTHH